MAAPFSLCLNQLLDGEPHPIGSKPQEGCDLGEVSVAELVPDGLTAECCLLTALLEAGTISSFLEGRTAWCISMFITVHSLSHLDPLLHSYLGTAPFGFWWVS